jgi:hypothetical protein
MSTESSGKPDAWKLARPVWGWGRGATPWPTPHGFEHTVTEARRFRPDADPDVREMQGCVYSEGDRERIVIELPKGEDYGIYDYLRAAGASKQVAREAVAAERRRTLAQLAKWVKCEFEALGDEYAASVWGIDDEDYAEREVKEEIAYEVAHQLEAAGYNVTGKPDRQAGYNAHRREVKKDRLTRNMAAQNWAAR